MKHRTEILVVLAVLILSTACAQGEFESMAAGSSGGEMIQTPGEGIQLQQEGIGPIEITPPPPGEAPSLAPPGAEGGNISSRGERTTGGNSDGQPGRIDSNAPGELTLEEQTAPVVDWLTYQDQDFGFTIDYPGIFVVLVEQGGSPASQSGLLKTVRFLDQQLAAGDTADLEIPDFNIEVYDLGDETLDSFLKGDQPRGVQEEYRMGDLNGLRVSLNQLIAPNEFYYFSDQDQVYRLTPLGEYGQQMLMSFQVR